MFEIMALVIRQADFPSLDSATTVRTWGLFSICLIQFTFMGLSQANRPLDTARQIDYTSSQYTWQVLCWRKMEAWTLLIVAGCNLITDTPDKSCLWKPARMKEKKKKKKAQTSFHKVLQHCHLVQVCRIAFAVPPSAENGKADKPREPA